jgi:hypothetical protein
LVSIPPSSADVASLATKASTVAGRTTGDLSAWAVGERINQMPIAAAATLNRIVPVHSNAIRTFITLIDSDERVRKSFVNDYNPQGRRVKVMPAR